MRRSDGTLHSGVRVSLALSLCALTVQASAAAGERHVRTKLHNTGVSSVLVPARPVADPFPQNDGFIYPGRPGSEGLAAYNSHWSQFNAHRKKPRATDWTRDVAWMLGQWIETVRDYVFPPAPARIAIVGEGPATISFSLERRWLVIQSAVPRWPATRYLGYDAGRARWVWREVLAPGIEQSSAYSPGWMHGRLPLGPRTVDYHGLKSFERVTLIREGADTFRVVSEVRVAPHRWVAADDIVFTRAPTH